MAAAPPALVPEDDAKVRTRIRRTVIPNPDGRADHTARSVAAEHVECLDRTLLSPLVDDGRAHAIVVLLQRVQRPAQRQMARLKVGDRLPQYLLNHRLGDLLPRLCDQLGATWEQS